MYIKNTFTFSLSFVLMSFCLNSANAQVYLEKYSTGHADISLWYKVGKFKIFLGPCLAIGREKEYIGIHVPMVKGEYSYNDVWVKHSSEPMKLIKGTIKIDTVKRIIIVDLYEEKDGGILPLVVNGKHRLTIEELKNFSERELHPDNCVFKN